MAMDLGKVIAALRLNELSRSKRGYVLQLVTKGLNLQNNKTWKNFIFNVDPYYCKDYMKLTQKELLKADGRTLIDWNEEDITPKDIITAIKAKIPLTRSMIQKCKKIKNKFTNDLIIKLELDKDSVHGDWYKLFDKNGKSFMEICPKHDVLNYMNLFYVFRYPNVSEHYVNNIISCYKLPVNIKTVLLNVYKKIKEVDYYRYHNKEITNLFSGTHEEDEAIEGYLNIKFGNFRKYVNTTNHYVLMNKLPIALLEAYFNYYNLDQLNKKGVK